MLLTPLFDRLRDRWRESQWRVTLTPAGRDDGLAAPVLNVSGVPATPRSGDVARQLLARLHVESTERAVALLAPHKRGLSLDFWTSEARFSLAFPRRWSGDPLTPDPDWLAAVRRSGERTGARLIHVESVTGLSLPSLVELARGSVPVVFSAHDLALFCADDDRASRALIAELVERAAAVVCPSAYVRDRLVDEYSPALAARLVMIAPGIGDVVLDERSRRDAESIAYVGSLAPHKGGALAVDVIAELAGRGRNVTVYGDDGRVHLRQLRGVVGVDLRGYYGTGRLPDLLVAQGASVAIVISRTPEAFGLEVSDAWAAGVPVVAAGDGAFVERLTHRGGAALPSDASVAAIADAVDALRSRPARVPPPPAATTAAAAHTALYLAVAPALLPVPPTPQIAG